MLAILVFSTPASFLDRVTTSMQSLQTAQHRFNDAIYLAAARTGKYDSIV